MRRNTQFGTLKSAVDTNVNIDTSIIMGSINDTIFTFCILLCNIIVHAAKLSPCALKRDASYAGFAHFSNDRKAYETFFEDTFSECAISSVNHISQTLLKIDGKNSCVLT